MPAVHATSVFKDTDYGRPEDEEVLVGDPILQSSSTTRQRNMKAHATSARILAISRRPLVRWISLIVFLGCAWSLLSAFRPAPPEAWDDGVVPGLEDVLEDVEGGPGPAAPAPDVTTAKLMQSRKNEVKASFQFAWKGYMKHAFPHDEILPVSGRTNDRFNGWSVTLVDSLSTMWVMDLKDEFYSAVKAIGNQTFTKTTSTNSHIPFFETTIRYLGGYLSAYALSKEPIILSLADDLGKTMLPVFNTPSGLPAGGVAPVTGNTIPGDGLLAEIGSCQLEYKYLAKLTGRAEYYEKVEHVMSHLYKAPTYRDLFGEKWSEKTGKPHGEKYTVAANTDSAYEYFLKQYLMVDDKRALAQYLKSIDSVIENLLYLSPSRGLLYLTDVASWDGKTHRPSHSHEHLGCFLGGLLALGAHTLPARLAQDPTISSREAERMFPRETRQKHMWAAEGLTYTCWVLYADQASGLSSDGTTFDQESKPWIGQYNRWARSGAKGRPPGTLEPSVEKDAGKRDYRNINGRWIMRPETVESIYLMWKTTQNPAWRERGYGIYQAIEKHAKTKYGYTSVRSVDNVPLSHEDEMPSYFLAETLKYLYLLFDDEDPIDLTRWVFNTEAHPLPAFSWSAQERERFGVVSA